MIGLLQRHLTSQIDDQLIATAHTIRSPPHHHLRRRQPGCHPHSLLRPYSTWMARIATSSEDTLKSGCHPARASMHVLCAHLLLPHAARHSPSQRPDSAGAFVNPRLRPDTSYSRIHDVALPCPTPSAPCTTASYFASPAHYRHHRRLGGRVLVRRALLPLRSIESPPSRSPPGDLTKRLTPPHPPHDRSRLPVSLHSTLCSQVEQSFERRVSLRRKNQTLRLRRLHGLRTPWQRSPDTASCTQWACPPNASRRSRHYIGKPGLPAWPPWSRLLPLTGSTRDAHSTLPTH